MSPSKLKGWLKKLCPSAKAANNSFCIQPFHNIYVLQTGEIKPCCVFEGTIPGDKGSSTGKDVIENVWNAAQMRDIRLRMAAGEAIDACRYCYRQEGKGVISPRQATTNGWSDGWLNAERRTSEEILFASIRNGFRSEPETLQIVLGSTCNLKCRHCYMDSSSAIAADPVHTAWAPVSPFVSTNGIAFKSGTKDIIAELLRNPTRFKSVTASGGEGLIMKEMQEIMRHLIEAGAAKQTALVTFTNATVVSEAWCELASQFKTMVVTVSLDGYRAVNDYIRYPSKWGEVEAGLRRIQKIPNAIVAVSMTVQAYNVFDIVELSQFCEQAGVPLYPNILTEPPHLSSFILPISIRREAASRLRSYAENSDVLWRSNMLSIADAWEAEIGGNPSLLQDFMAFTNDLDISRNQSFSSTFPELLQMLKTSGAEWNAERRFVR